MKLKQIKVGGYYIAKQAGGHVWYIKVTKIDRNMVYTSGSFTKDGDWYGGDVVAWADDANKWEYTEMTTEEKAWMDICISKKRYVEFDEIKTTKTMKKGDLFTIPKGAKLKFRAVVWGKELKDEEGMERVGFGEKKLFDIQEWNGETWGMFEEPDYTSGIYWMARIKDLESIINNKKQTKMKTTKKAIPIAQVRKWPSKDLVSGQKFTTAQGEMMIHRLANGDTWVVGKGNVLNGGKPGRMPAGYSDSWYLGAHKEYDLTCSGKLSAFKQTVEEEEKVMEFSQNFKVEGPAAILRAFKEEAEEIGWTFFGSEIPKKGNTTMVFDRGRFSVSNASVSGEYWDLAEGEWDRAIDDLNEKKEVDNVEYLLCTEDGKHGSGLSKGRIYKRDIEGEDEYNREEETYLLDEVDVVNSWDEEFNWSKDFFVPSTQEEFEAQGANIFAVGGHKINIKEVKINGYEPMNMACIGCANSQQVYSVGALKALYDAMCDDEATFDEEDVTFTKDQVEALIEALGG